MITRTPPTARPRCGEYAGYAAHYRNGEEPCEPCRLARNDYVASTRDIGQQMARENARNRALSQLAQRYPDEYRELFEAEYPNALAEQRAKNGGAS